uniref:Uncharacterized protein n=1 Tax=Anguilla anguilla TaxID=7936 RepID=A0A0E9RZU4_ANGAN
MNITSLMPGDMTLRGIFSQR